MDFPNININWLGQILWLHIKDDLDFNFYHAEMHCFDHQNFNDVKLVITDLLDVVDIHLTLPEIIQIAQLDHESHQKHPSVISVILGDRMIEDKLINQYSLSLEISASDLQDQTFIFKSRDELRQWLESHELLEEKSLSLI